MAFWIFGLGCFTLGVVLGSELANHRWRDNANRIGRIESRGSLYKVNKMTSH